MPTRSSARPALSRPVTSLNPDLPGAAGLGSMTGDSATAAGIGHNSLVSATNRLRRLLETQQNDSAQSR
uniref:hypothetical protein n=1 Tax=unclassified Rhodococcus (in: high G+C Gram-positive bacteria) TaxID=192944 RepID=UPI0011406E07|nr:MULTISPECIES: hypothetical protein [unclassified Rhodococcus (in: high G+C Gram-positive bacteria)]